MEGEEKNKVKNVLEEEVEVEISQYVEEQKFYY